MILESGAGPGGLGWSWGGCVGGSGGVGGVSPGTREAQLRPSQADLPPAGSGVLGPVVRRGIHPDASWSDPDCCCALDARHWDRRLAFQNLFFSL